MQVCVWLHSVSHQERRSMDAIEEPVMDEQSKSSDDKNKIKKHCFKLYWLPAE